MSGFHNYVFTKLGTLVLKALRSPNYVAGTSGWSIKKDGSAEFNNLAIRGTFNGTDFIVNSSGAFFYSGTPAAGNLIASIASVAGTDGFGNAYGDGFVSFNTSTGTNTQIHGGAGLELNNPTTTAFSPGIVGLTNALFTAGEAAVEILSPLKNSTDVLAEIICEPGLTGGKGAITHIGQAVFPDGAFGRNPATAAIETWHAMSLINGWAAFAAPTVAAQYRKSALANTVEIIGTINAAGKTANVFATLPAGYRPASQQSPCAAGTSGGTTEPNTAYVQCDTSGNLSALGYPSGLSSFQFHGFISLDA